MLHPTFQFIARRQEREMQKRLTIQDIARLAGVSKATVSRVLNNNPSVDPVLKERVRRIVQEYDFVPNITATSLAGGRTSLIGVLAPPLSWPAIPEIMGGIAEYIEHTSYEIVLYSINFERNHSDVLDRILAMRMVCGLLAIFPGKLYSHLASRYQQGLPLVMIDDQEEPANIPWVGIDNMGSAYKATRYLLELGHRRIAHIQGPQKYHCAIERYQGYCQALQDAGITPDPEMLLLGSFDVASGRQCASMLFARDRSTWPSAIFAGNDQMAYGILEIAEQQGIRVPDDIAIIGFDDNILSAHMKPPLSTIRQPFPEMGSKAVEMLLTMVDPDHRASVTYQNEYAVQESASTRVVTDAGHPMRIQLPTSLVVRASSGSARPLSISP
jgi:LacI family transcriptional regulator